MVGLFVVGGVVVVALLIWVGTRPASPPRPRPGHGAKQPLRQFTYEQLKAQMAAMAQPALVMQKATTPGFSKLGGEPDLPPSVEWPAGPAGPMGFLLQVDLAEARAAGGPAWLPSDGALWVFLDDRWEEPDQARVLYAGPGERVQTTPPIAVQRAWRYRERFIEFANHRSEPSPNWLGVAVEEVDVSDEEMDKLCEKFSDSLKEHHWIGGYPLEQQEIEMPIAAECAARGLDYYALGVPSDELREAAKAWRLLVQFDYDDELKMKWAGSGHVYVFIREADALAGDFSRTVTLFDMT